MIMRTWGTYFLKPKWRFSQNHQKYATFGHVPYVIQSYYCLHNLTIHRKWLKFCKSMMYFTTKREMKKNCIEAILAYADMGWILPWGGKKLHLKVFFKHPNFVCVCYLKILSEWIIIYSSCIVWWYA